VNTGTELVVVEVGEVDVVGAGVLVVPTEVVIVVVPFPGGIITVTLEVVEVTVTVEVMDPTALLATLLLATLLLVETPAGGVMNGGYGGRKQSALLTVEFPQIALVLTPTGGTPAS